MATTLTFVNNIDSNGDLDVDGHTELDHVNVSLASTFSGLIDINAGAEINSLKVEDLTNDRVVIAGSGGELEDDSNLTFDGSTLSVGVNLDVDGATTLDDTTLIVPRLMELLLWMEILFLVIMSRFNLVIKVVVI